VDVYTASRFVLAACWLALVVRVLLVVALIALLVAIVSVSIWKFVSVIVLALFVVTMAAYLGFAFTLRCPACRRRFLMESGPKHSAARRAQHSGYWGTVVWDVVRRRQFICMYCGALCQVSKPTHQS
jgi:hypothetical protein